MILQISLCLESTSFQSLRGRCLTDKLSEDDQLGRKRSEQDDYRVKLRSRTGVQAYSQSKLKLITKVNIVTNANQMLSEAVIRRYRYDGLS